jgi:hypothetical protein
MKGEAMTAEQIKANIEKCRKELEQQEGVENEAMKSPWSWGAPPLKGWPLSPRPDSNRPEDRYLIVISRNLNPARLAVAREELTEAMRLLVHDGPTWHCGNHLRRAARLLGVDLEGA